MDRKATESDTTPEFYMSPCGEMYATTRKGDANIIVKHKYGSRTNTFYQNKRDHKVYCYFTDENGARHPCYRAAFPELGTEWLRLPNEPDWS